jgi:hypothetical protein
LSNDAHGPFYTVSHDDLVRWQDQVKALQARIEKQEAKIAELQKLIFELAGAVHVLIVWCQLWGKHENESRN